MVSPAETSGPGSYSQGDVYRIDVPLITRSGATLPSDRGIALSMLFAETASWNLLPDGAWLLCETLNHVILLLVASGELSLSVVLTSDTWNEVINVPFYSEEGVPCRVTLSVVPEEGINLLTERSYHLSGDLFYPVADSTHSAVPDEPLLPIEGLPVRGESVRVGTHVVAGQSYAGVRQSLWTRELSLVQDRAVVPRLLC